jgi:hypothetical protein
MVLKKEKRNNETMKRKNAMAFRLQKKNLREFWELFKTLAPLLTVLALIMSIWQLRNAREFKKNLNDISQSVSTKFIDKFPKNMDSIIKLVDETKEELDIVVDFASYGQFSNFELYEKYKSKIFEKILMNVKVRITCYRRGIIKSCGRRKFENEVPYAKIKFGKFKNLTHRRHTAHERFYQKLH